MMPTHQGSFRLFRLAGIQVYLHWSWFLVAAYEVSGRTDSYSSLFWNILEYLALFGIVLMHEFGHSMACRQVGGQANQIVLWPLGGVAYVAPPQRPGAMLWSIAAGPLVNLLLLPVLLGVNFLSRFLGWADSEPSLHALIVSVSMINLVLLVFNLLPIYPLDGGQILRSLLWFVMGQARSLLVTSLVGFGGVALVFLLALVAHSIWFAILATFILFNCWRGLRTAQAMAKAAKAPRHQEYACPACGNTPPAGEFWTCGRCRKTFDSFATQAACPHCGAQYTVTQCLTCGEARPFSAWVVPPSGLAMEPTSGPDAF